MMERRTFRVFKKNILNCDYYRLGRVALNKCYFSEKSLTQTKIELDKFCWSSINDKLLYDDSILLTREEIPCHSKSLSCSPCTMWTRNE